jgi:hypothetical protein
MAVQMFSLHQCMVSTLHVHRVALTRMCARSVYAPDIEFYPCTGPPTHGALPPTQPLSGAPLPKQPAAASNILNVVLPLGVTGEQFRRAVIADVIPVA